MAKKKKRNGLTTLIIVVIVFMVMTSFNGGKEGKKEGFGCSTRGDSTIQCEDYIFTNCPEGCIESCAPSCPMCLDCGGPGSCRTSGVIKYYRADFPSECKLIDENTGISPIIIDPLSPEAIKCEQQYDCRDLDLLFFDYQKCEISVVTYEWRS